MKHLKELSALPGVSGNEHEVRDYIRNVLKEEGLNTKTDAMGNLLVSGRGREDGNMGSNGRPSLLLAAHMDEVGLMVSGIEKNGMLRFKKVGSIDDRILAARQVLIGKDKIPGIIGGKAIHLQKPEERRKPYQTDNLYIDIGAKDKDEGEKKVRLGDYISFKSSFRQVGDDCLMGKAFDDRAGCAILLELLADKTLPPFQAAFTVQEETGLRGAVIAAHALQPRTALVVETTSASDVPETKDHRQSTVLGAGPAITFMDASVVVDRELSNRLAETATAHHIPYQMRRFTGGGTDGGPIAVSRSGVKTAVISVPCRYIHSPHSIINQKDWENTLHLTRLFIKN